MKLTTHQYGKSSVRVARIIREGERHHIIDADVQVMLRGDFASSYTSGDNSLVVPTDTMKNTVNVLAQTELTAEIERFGRALAQHFLAKYAQVEECEITLTAKRWERLGEHPHAFSGNDQMRAWAQVKATREQVKVRAGVRDLLVLKTTASAFVGFPRCDLTTLPEATDRIFATNIAATWSYAFEPADYVTARQRATDALLAVFANQFSPSVQTTLYQMAAEVLAVVPEISRVHLAMPNKHYLPVNLAPFGRENPNEVFTPTDEPHGQIEATVER